MPTLTQAFVKASLLYLIAGLLTGLALAARSVLALPAWVAALSPVYFHLFLVGWVTELIFGVVYWMFPKATREQPRGSEALGWATFGLLNVGLVLRVVGEPLNAVSPTPLSGWLLAISAGLQWLAGLLFVVNTWPRVKRR